MVNIFFFLNSFHMQLFCADTTLFLFFLSPWVSALNTIFSNKKFRNCVCFFTCILPNYMANNIFKDSF